MASEREEQVVVVWWKVGELVDKDLWDASWFWTCHSGHAALRLLRKQLVWQFPKPPLKERSDNVDIVEFALLKEIDVEFYYELAVIMQGEQTT